MGPKSVGVIGFVGDDDSAAIDIGKKRFRASQVMGLAGCNQELDWPALAVHPRVDFRRRARRGFAPYGDLHSFFDLGGVLVSAHDRTADHLHVAVMRLADGIHQSIPDACFAPAIEAVVSRRVGAITLRQIPLRRPRPQHPKHAIHDPTVVLAPRSWTDVGYRFASTADCQNWRKAGYWLRSLGDVPQVKLT
jgi:hypothetical protein